MKNWYLNQAVADFRSSFHCGKISTKLVRIFGFVINLKQWNSMAFNLRSDTKRLVCLAVLLGSYLLSGAAVFRILENDNDKVVIEDLNAVRDNLMAKHNMSREQFSFFATKIEEAIRNRCDITSVKSWCETRWSYYESLYFTWSVVTTIGKQFIALYLGMSVLPLVSGIICHFQNSAGRRIVFLSRPIFTAPTLHGITPSIRMGVCERRNVRESCPNHFWEIHCSDIVSRPTSVVYLTVQYGTQSFTTYFSFNRRIILIDSFQAICLLGAWTTSTCVTCCWLYYPLDLLIID